MKGLFNQSNQNEKQNPIKIIDENHIPISINSNPNRNKFYFNQPKSNIATSYFSIGSKIKKNSKNNLSLQKVEKNYNNNQILSFHIKSKTKNSLISNSHNSNNNTLQSNETFFLMKDKYLKENIKHNLKKKPLKIQLFKAETLKLKLKFPTERNNNNLSRNNRNFSYENQESNKLNFPNCNHNKISKTLITFNNCNKSIFLSKKKNSKKTKKKIYIKNLIDNNSVKYKTLDLKNNNNYINNPSEQYFNNENNIKLNLNPILEKSKFENKENKHLTNINEETKLVFLEKEYKKEKIKSFDKKIQFSNLINNKKKKKINQINQLFNINNLNDLPKKNFDASIMDLYSVVKKINFNSIKCDSNDNIFSYNNNFYLSYSKNFENQFNENYNFIFSSNQKIKFDNLSTQQNSNEKKLFKLDKELN